MLNNNKTLAAALEQRYNQRSPQSSVRDVKVKITNEKEEKEEQLRKEKEDVEKMEFFKSKKAKQGMPSSVRKKALKEIMERMKNSSKK